MSIKHPSADEIPLSRIRPALQEPLKAERIIKEAIAELPVDQREGAGGMRAVHVAERSLSGGGVDFYVNKDFLTQLVLDGKLKTNGANAGKAVGDLIAEAGLASKYPQGRNC